MEHFNYMHFRNSIGSFTHIECGKKTVLGTNSGVMPIWLLVCKSDHAESKIWPVISRNDLTFEQLDQWLRDGLLHILHTGWLNPNDTRSFERFRYGNDLYGSFRIGFQEINAILLVVIPPVRQNVFSERKNPL
jgi:hypothetical protein